MFPSCLLYTSVQARPFAQADGPGDNPGLAGRCGSPINDHGISFRVIVHDQIIEFRQEKQGQKELFAFPMQGKAQLDGAQVYLCGQIVAVHMYDLIGGGDHRCLLGFIPEEVRVDMYLQRFYIDKYFLCLLYTSRCV